MTQHLMPVIKEKVTWGPGDPKISKLWMLAKEIAEHLDLKESKKDEADFLADRILDKLESALMYYQLITSDDFKSRNISQKRTIYEGLYANLWSFYKGRVQNFIKSMGWDVGFLFCREENFAKEAQKFIDNNPDHADVVTLARKQRKAWQNIFGHSRNVAEHSGDNRDGTPTFETPEDAKRLFAQVCWTAETFMVYFGSYKMNENWNIVTTDDKLTVFDHSNRFFIENSATTYMRERHPQGRNKK